MSPRFESEVATEKLNGQIRRSIQYLRRILDAGERGYAVAAAYVNNRALKMLFKTYAQQQATFKSELSKEMKPAFGGRHSVTDILAILHRGRINIFAAMTIGGLDRERVVLKENLIGERAALQAYNRARQSGLPGQLDALVRQQREAVQMAAQQKALMLGKDGKQLVVRLYDSDRDAHQAIRALQDAHLPAPGTFIGWRIDGGDEYLHDESPPRGQVLLEVETDPSNAVQAAQIMARVNREARSDRQEL